ncbi:MAG: tetratricopeptide repeat protein, partial [Myxococcota bacterium]
MAKPKSESTVDLLLEELEGEVKQARPPSMPPPVPGVASDEVMVLDDELELSDAEFFEEEPTPLDAVELNAPVVAAPDAAASVDSIELTDLDALDAQDALEDEEPVIHPRGLEELGFVELETDVGALPFVEAPVQDDAFTEDLRDAAVELIEACRQRLAVSDPRRAAELHHQMGRLYEVPLGELGRAVQHYQSALEVNATDAALIQDTRRALLLTKKYAPALELYDPEIRLSPDPREKAELLLEKGRLLRDRLNRADDAKVAFETALELDGTNLGVLQDLLAAYESAGAHDARERSLERAANSAADEAHRGALVGERAAVIERALGQPERAIGLYEQALALDPAAGGVMAALKRLYRERSRWSDLVRVLRQEAQLTTNPVEKASLLYDVARLLLEHLGDQPQALASLEEAAALAPSDRGVLERLVTLYEQSGRFEEQAKILRTLVQLATDTPSRLAILGELAALHQQRLDDRAGAIHWFESAITLDPLHGPSMQHLEALYEADGAVDKIIALRNNVAQHASSGLERASAFATIGLLEERAGRTDQAIAAHQRAMALDASNATSFKSLLRLLATERRFRDLLHLHERAADDADNADEAIAHHFDAGALLEGPLGQPELAIKAYEAVLSLEPANLRAMASLGRAAESANRSDVVLRALDMELDESKSDKKRTALLLRAATVHERDQNDVPGAVKRLRAVLAINDAHEDALETLARLFSAAGRWDELAEILERQLTLKTTAKAEGRVALAFRLAKLYRKQLGSEERARAKYQEAFNADPSHRQVARRFLRLLEDRREHDEAAAVLSKLADLEESPLAKARLLFRAGELMELRAQNAAEAASLYRRAVRSYDYGPARDALERLGQSKDSVRELAKSLSAYATSGAADRPAVDALFRESALWEHAGDNRKAVERLEAAVSIAPDHLGVLQALARLHRGTGRWEALAKVLASMGRVFRDPRARIAAMHAEAQVRASHRIGDRAAIIDIYRSVLALDPEDGAAIRALEALAAKEGKPSLIAEVEELAYRRPQTAAAKAGHATRLGAAYEAMNSERALEAFREALRLAPDDLAATRGLARMALRAPPEVRVEAAHQEARVAANGEQAAVHLMEAAEIRLDRLGDLEGAAADLERALTLAPNSRDASSRLAKLLRSQRQPERLRDALTRAASAATPDRSAELWMEAAELLATDLNDRPAAINILRRLLRNMPNHVPAMQQQAMYLRQTGDFSDAAALYERIVKRAGSNTVLRDTHLELATVWDDHLRDTQRAMVSLQAVLSIDPASVEGLSRLADIHEREERLHEATELAQRLLLNATEGPARASALLRLARLQRAQHMDAAASEALREAVTIEGPGSESALEVKASQLNQNYSLSIGNQYSLGGAKLGVIFGGNFRRNFQLYNDG